MLTNAELDHHTTYASQRDVDETFRAFLALGRHRGRLGPAAAARARRRTRSPTTPTRRARPDGSRVRVRRRGGRARACPALHNARNAAAALDRRRLAGADVARGRAALAVFTGAGRRFERLGTTPAGALVVDDYAHHPTEVRATIEAARTLAPRRVVAVFQPHLFSRTRAPGARVRRRARAAPTGSWCSRSTRRASAPRTSPASPGCWSPRRPPTPRGGRPVAWLPDVRRGRGATCAPSCATATCCLTLGAGDVDALGRRARSAERGPAPPGRRKRPMSGVRTVSARAPRLRLRCRASRRERCWRSLLAAGLLAGGWLWLRDSLAGRGRRRRRSSASRRATRARIRAALSDAAPRDDDAARPRRTPCARRRRSSRRSPALRIEADFPHGLTIEVVEHAPVAALDVDGAACRSTGGGHLLRGLRAERPADDRGQGRPPAATASPTRARSARWRSPPPRRRSCARAPSASAPGRAA